MSSRFLLSALEVPAENQTKLYECLSGACIEDFLDIPRLYPFIPSQYSTFFTTTNSSLRHLATRQSYSRPQNADRVHRSQDLLYTTTLPDWPDKMVAKSHTPRSINMIHVYQLYPDHLCTLQPWAFLWLNLR